MTEPIHAHDPIDQLVADGRAVPARRTAAERPKPLEFIAYDEGWSQRPPRTAFARAGRGKGDAPETE
jgi:hypothetical protein